jgi:ubiquitin carboxyl-terminal hydrolase 47
MLTRVAVWQLIRWTVFCGALVLMRCWPPSLLRWFCVQWEYANEERDGKQDECIPLQLQRLFAQLQLTRRAAVDTKSLTTSFGWTTAQAFRQHDVQELCRVLFDALEAGMGSLDVINSVFKAELVDFLACKECGQQRSRTDPYLDLDLAVGHGVSRLEDALAKFVTPEDLTGDNQWFCDACGRKVDASKGMGLATLPPILTIHLKR